MTAMFIAKYCMGKQGVQIEYDVHCDWKGNPPIYRLYINGELFTERTFVWRNQYLEEVIPIEAVPGDYVIKYELIGNGHISALNPRVNFGPAHFVANDVLRIENESP
jgi:hypothetical protein